MALIAGKIVEYVEYLIPHYWVQPSRCLVQHQQLRVVGQCRGYGQLHLHTSRKVLEGLLFRQPEFLYVAEVLIRIPFFISEPHNGIYVFTVQAYREICLVQHHAYVLLSLGKLGAFIVHAQYLYAAGIGQYGVHYELYGGRLACAVFAYEAHYAAFGQTEGKAIQRKVTVCL